MTSINYSAVSNMGYVRTNNEDNFFVNGALLDEKGENTVISGTVNNQGMFAVCDGMGGAEYGEVASGIAVSVMKNLSEYEKGQFEDFCIKYINEANDTICKEMDRRSGSRMGTTFALLYISKKFAHICNIGDSRVYLLRNNKLKLLSQDHTQIRQMVENGVLTEEQAKIHPYRHRLTQHLGIYPYEMELEPYFCKEKLLGGDKYLLCSDGLTDLVTDGEIENILINTENAESTAKELRDLALNKGGIDNVTVIVLEIEKATWLFAK